MKLDSATTEDVLEGRVTDVYFRRTREILEARGFDDIDLFVSGGIDEEEILRLDELADGYGVGGAIAAAPIVDFSMDIVEIDGEGLAKRGKWSGSKQVFRCGDCGRRHIDTRDAEPRPCRACGGDPTPLLETAVEAGERVRRSDPEEEIRDRVLAALAELPPPEAP